MYLKKKDINVIAGPEGRRQPLRSVALEVASSAFGLFAKTVIIFSFCALIAPDARATWRTADAGQLGRIWMLMVFP